MLTSNITSSYCFQGQTANLPISSV